MLRTDYEQIDRLLYDFEERHSEFQVRHFILGRQATPYGRYKQALRELDSRRNVLISLKDKRDLLEIDIDEYEAKSKSPEIPAGSILPAPAGSILQIEPELNSFSSQPFERRRIELKLSQAKRSLHEIGFQIVEAERETEVFLAEALDLKASIGDLTDEKRRLLEAKLWTQEALAHAALDYLSQGRLSPSTVEMIFSLPVENRQTVLNAITPDNQPALISWAENKP